jgi:hypothetical protein
VPPAAAPPEEDTDNGDLRKMINEAVVLAHPRLGSCAGADIIAMGTRAYILTLITFNYTGLGVAFPVRPRHICRLPIKRELDVTAVVPICNGHRLRPALPICLPPEQQSLAGRAEAVGGGAAETSEGIVVKLMKGGMCLARGEGVVA